MKKIIFIILICNSISFAQSIKIGFRAAGEVAWFGVGIIRNVSASNYKNSPLYESYSLGVTSDIVLTKNIILKPEILFNKSHSNADLHKKDSIYLTQPTLIEQVQLPLLLKILIKNNYFLFGASTGFITNKINGLLNKNIDIGLNIGFGMTIPNSNINLDIRYYNGIINIAKYSYHQNFANIGLSWLLPIIK